MSRGVMLPLLLAAALAGGRFPAAVADEPPGQPRWAAAAYVDRDRRVGLSWSPVPGATGYRVFRAEGAGDMIPHVTVGEPRHLDARIEPGRTYRYGVQALSGEAAGPISEERVVATPAPPAGGEVNAPRLTKVVVRMVEQERAPPRFSIHLSWRPVAGAAGYQVLRQREGEPFVLDTVGEPWSQDAAVAPGATYTYFVRALNEALVASAPSAGRTVTVSRETARVLVPAAAAPSELSASVVWRVENEPDGKSGVPGRALLGDPYDVAHDAARDRVYVSSASRRQVVILRAADGAVVGQLGPAIGKFELKLPLGLALDRAGVLHIVDQADGSVVVVGPDGKPRRRIVVPAPKGGKPPRLIDAAVLPDGRLVVSDNANHTLVVLADDGRVLARWAPPAKGPGAFAGVAAVAVTASGAVAAADAAAGAIRLFSGRGSPRSSIGRRGLADGEISFMGGITPVAADRFLVADVWRSSISLVGPADSGARPLRIEAPGSADGGSLIGPVNLAGGDRGLLFVVEGAARRVTALRLGPLPPPAAAPGARP